MQNLNFLSIEGNGAKIILGRPDPKKWDLVEVFLKYSVAVSYVNTERDNNPGVRLLIQPFKGGEAAVYKERM